MGRITIFSIDECQFCRRSKAALSSRYIPYVEINISTHTSRRSDMLALTDRLTVPQVFFNDVHVGGAEEMLALLQRWDDEKTHETPAERYEGEIGSQHGPTDERLRLPEPPSPPESSANQEPFLLRKREEAPIQITPKQAYSVLDLTVLLLGGMPCADLSHVGMLYMRCFKGSDGVTALMKIFQLQSRKEAMRVGVLLQQKQFLDHVTHDHNFGDGRYYFRLQPMHQTHVLGTFRVWGSIDENGSNGSGDNDAPGNPMAIITRLGKMWGTIESRHWNDEGMVDYVAVRNDEEYWNFEEAFCELQDVSLDDMGNNTNVKKAFLINLYNLMIKVAFAKVGVPKSTMQRGAFFDKVSVLVGTETFSFSDIENGILRANSRAPYSISRRFDKSDPRRRLAMPDVDHRIHFALNCGATSCPPVKKYTAEALEEELRIVAMAFCEQDESVRIVKEKREVHLSKIFSWYMSDFGDSKKALVAKVAQYLRGDKKKELDALLASRGDVSVKYLDYDWSTDDCKSLSFDKVQVKRRSFVCRKVFHRQNSTS